MNKNMTRLAAAVSAALLVAQSTYAQEEPKSGGYLEEVIVTARKITENMQSVPVAVSTLSGSEIRSLGVATAADVLAFTPSATITAGAVADVSGMSLRGVSSGNRGASEDSGLLVMEDGEAVTRGFMHNASLYDVKRVEVLRGPQGTTFGRNATAGVINFITERPSQVFESRLIVNAGNYSLLDVEGFVSGALTDTVSGRLSGKIGQRDGYSENAITGDDLDAEDYTNLRGQVLFEPSDNFSILFKAHWSDYHNDLFGVRKRIHDTDVGMSPFTQWDYVTYSEESEGPWKTENSDGLGGYDRTIWGALLNVRKDFDKLSLVSITSYRDGEDDSEQDLSGTPYHLADERAQNDAQTFSQEFRLSNENDSDSALGWQVGLYYLHEEHERKADTLFFGGLCEFYPDECINPPAIGGFLPLPTMDDLATNQLIGQSNETDSYGIFGELTYDFTEKTNILVGARYSYDEKSYTGIVDADGAISFFFVDAGRVEANSGDDWDDVSGKIALTHAFSDTIMGYVSGASAYKSGAFNAEPTSADALNAVDPEYVVTYEAGLKMDLLDDRFRLNLTAFFSDYEDIQATFITETLVAVADNVGEAEIKGYEIEGLAYLTRDLSVTFTYANLDSEYTKFDNGEGGDVEGNPVQGTPDWTASVAVNYDIPLESGALISLRGDYRGRGDIHTRFDDTTFLTVRPGADIFNATAKFTSSDERWSAAVWGRNLAEEEEIVYIAPGTGLFVGRTGVYGNPRTYGVTLEYNF